MAHRATQVYEMVQSGDPISDSDLAFGRTYFKELAAKLWHCGPVFKLAAREADHTYQTLDGYYQARQSR